MSKVQAVAIVTGGGSGIGKETVKVLCEKHNAQVVIFDKAIEAAQVVAQELGSRGYKVAVKQVDVSDGKCVAEAVRAVEAEVGPVMELINVAGVISTKPFLECSEDEWDFVLSINLRGVYNCIRAVLPYMVERQCGRIVNIASAAGKRGGGVLGNSIYATSKAGVIGLTKAIAREFGPLGIRVNAICPGPIDTNMMKSFTGPKKDFVLQTIPMRRFGKPKEVAEAAAFLASDEASFITGEIMDVDGGLTMD